MQIYLKVQYTIWSSLTTTVTDFTFPQRKVYIYMNNFKIVRKHTRDSINEYISKDVRTNLKFTNAGMELIS
jgi:hypothetical protein